MTEKISPNFEPEFEIALWAAGAREALPVADGDNDNDPERLRAILAFHRLAPRMNRWLREIEGPLPAWAAAIGDWLREEAAKACRNRDRQVRALAEIAAAWPAAAGPLVPIKGLSAIALTGSDVNLRYIQDIDVFASDPEALAAALEGLGYQVSRNGGDAYEFATGFRDAAAGGAEESSEPYRIKVEVHQYYPVWSYPDSLRVADLRPEYSPERWVQRHSVPREARITYDDLRAGARTGVIPGAPSVAVPSPEMAVLVLCAHEGHNLITPVFRWLLPARLFVLADIRDLTRLDGFDVQRFLALAERFGAHDAVALIHSLLLTYWGESPFPLPVPWTRPFPRNVTYTGIWAEMHPREDPLRPQEGEAAIRRLAPTRVQAAMDERPSRPRYATHPDPAAGERPLRHLLASRAGRDLPIALSAVWSERSLILHVELPVVPAEGGGEWEVEVHAGDYMGFYHASYIRTGDRGHARALRLLGLRIASLADAGSASGRVQLQIALPWGHLLAPTVLPTGEAEIALMLVVNRTDAAERDTEIPSLFRADPVLAVPILAGTHRADVAEGSQAGPESLPLSTS